MRDFCQCHTTMSPSGLFLRSQRFLHFDLAIKLKSTCSTELAKHLEKLLMPNRTWIH